MFKKDKPVYRRIADLKPKQKKGPNKKLIGLGMGSVAALLATAFKNREPK